MNKGVIRNESNRFNKKRRRVQYHRILRLTGTQQNKRRKVLCAVGENGNNLYGADVCGRDNAETCKRTVETAVTPSVKG